MHKINKTKHRNTYMFDKNFWEKKKKELNANFKIVATSYVEAKNGIKEQELHVDKYNDISKVLNCMLESWCSFYC